MNMLSMNKHPFSCALNKASKQNEIERKTPVYFICNDLDEVKLLSGFIDDKWNDTDDNQDEKPIVICWQDYLKKQNSYITELPNIELIDLEDYYSTLKTQEFGHLLIYGEILTSTQNLLMNHFKFFQKGLVAVTDEQKNGRGRTSNQWVSPRGCLMFSFKLQLSNPNYICFVQYIISICIIRGIKKNEDCKDLDIGIKWPNDIYINKKLKIGGILCQSIYANTFDITVGCGININNYKPSTCIDEQASILNQRTITLSRGNILANILNEFEIIWNQFVNEGFEPFQQEYLSLWLHTNQKVKVNNNNQMIDATILGLTQEGFLLATSEDGTSLQLLPDGNSFNFLEGLISKKL